MSGVRQILVIFLLFLLYFFFIRGFIGGLLRYQLNKSSYRKKRKNESIKEWLLYTNYKDVIPKAWVRFYYLVIIVHIFSLIICTILYVLEKYNEIGEFFTITLFIVDIVSILIIHLLFFKVHDGYAYERWINRTRGQK